MTYHCLKKLCNIWLSLATNPFTGWALEMLCHSWYAIARCPTRVYFWLRMLKDSTVLLAHNLWCSIWDISYLGELCPCLGWMCWVPTYLTLLPKISLKPPFHPIRMCHIIIKDEWLPSIRTNTCKSIGGKKRVGKGWWKDFRIKRLWCMLAFWKVWSKNLRRIRCKIRKII